VGNPPSVGLNLGWNGNVLVLLVGTGTTVTAYNATTGDPLPAPNSFSTTNLFNSNSIDAIGSTDAVTALGSYASEAIQLINLPASLQSGQAVAVSKPSTFTQGLNLGGGLTGLPGSTSIYAAVAAKFNPLEPDQYQLGSQPFGTTSVMTVNKQSVLTNTLNAGTASAVKAAGKFIHIKGNAPPNFKNPGPALGSIDQSLAYVIKTSNSTSTVLLSSGGTLTLPDQITALSQAFRPDLETQSAAVIDIQGDVQSIRGGSANGMVLNDTGNLNLLKFWTVTNSTIVGQPVGHIQIQNRSNVTILTPTRTVKGTGGINTHSMRNDVMVIPGLQPIGPLSQPNDEPRPND
jgi:hypothetical protein